MDKQNKLYSKNKILLGNKKQQTIYPYYNMAESQKTLCYGYSTQSNLEIQCNPY